MDEALVPHAKRLRIGKSNFRLLSDTKSKESTLQLVYDVMRLNPFFKAFLFGALLPIELTNEDIKNSNAYKEYYAVAIGTTQPKPKASVWKTRSSSDTTITPPTAAAIGEASNKEKHAANTYFLSKWFWSRRRNCEEGDNDGEESDNDDDDDDQEVKRDDEKDDEEEGGDDEQASDEEEFIHPSLSRHTEEETKDVESFDPIPKTPENTDDEGNGEEDLGLNIGWEERYDEEEDGLYKDTPILIKEREYKRLKKLKTRIMLNPTLDVGMESIFKTTSQMDVQTPTSVAPLPMFVPTITPSTIATVTIIQHAPTLPITATGTPFQDLPNFGSLFGFDNRLKTLEANFSEFMQTNSLLELREEAQKENDEFLKTINENMQKIIKEQVKEQAKEQVSKILPKIEQTVNEQLEAEVLTWSSNSSKTFYAVAADLSEMELKKILIKKMKGNKSIHRSNEQRNLYKALVEAYESKKIILDTYGDTVMLKRRRDDDADKDKEPSIGPDRGESATTEEPMQTTFEMEEPIHPEFETGADDQPIVESSQHPEWFSPQQKPPIPDRDWNKTLLATYGSIQPRISELMKQSNSRSSFNELMDTLVDFSNFLINRLKMDTLTSEILADQLDWVNPEGQQYPHNLLKPLPLIPNNQSLHVIPFDHFINNDLEYLRGGYSNQTRRITKPYSSHRFIAKCFNTGNLKMEVKRKEACKSVTPTPATKEPEEEEEDNTTLDLLREKGLTVESEGDKAILIEGWKLPLIELTALWHALNMVKANWIVHVTDVRQRDYFEMCIIAAKRAGWIVNDHSPCLLRHAGFGLVQADDFDRFQTLSTEVVSLVNLFEEAKSRCKAILVGQ
nr:aminoacyl-tRNA synthetase, class 1a, anticodon-binding [Tanacetum cinerariifolium]